MTRVFFRTHTSEETGKPTVVVTVSEHKKAWSTGWETVCINWQLIVKAIDRYVAEIRPRILSARASKNDQGYLFPSSRTGDKMKQQNDAWGLIKKLVLKHGKDLGDEKLLSTVDSQVFRKAFSQTAVADKRIGPQRESKLLSHSEKVQRESYQMEIVDQDNLASSQYLWEKVALPEDSGIQPPPEPEQPPPEPEQPPQVPIQPPPLPSAPKVRSLFLCYLIIY